MIVLLDTTVLIDALRSRGDCRAQLAGLVEAQHRLATSAMNIGEVYAGMRAKEAEMTEAFLSGLEIYPMTGAIARRAGSLKSEWARRGKTLSLADMVIAATALEHGMVLMTENRRDFPVAGLEFYAVQA